MNPTVDELTMLQYTVALLEKVTITGKEVQTFNMVMNHHINRIKEIQKERSNIGNENF